MIYLVYAFGDGILSAGFEGMAGFPALLAQLVQNFIFLQMAFGIIAGLGVSLGIIYFLFRTTPGKVFREYLEAVKKKICPLVVVDKKPTEGK